MAAILCPKCFYRITDVTKPCSHCGCSVEEITAAIERRAKAEEEERQKEEESKRKEEEAKQNEEESPDYEAAKQLLNEDKAIKCPTCGTIVSNIFNDCPKCGCSYNKLCGVAAEGFFDFTKDGTLIGRKTEDEISDLKERGQVKTEQQRTKEILLFKDGKAIKCPNCGMIITNLSQSCSNCAF